MSDEWYEQIKNREWKPTSKEIRNITYRSSTPRGSIYIYYRKGVEDQNVYHIKYTINGGDLQVDYLSLQILNIASDTDLIEALVQNHLVQKHHSYSPRIKDMLRMEESEETECTDLNQCTIPSILIWIDMLTGQPKIASPVYDNQGVFCLYTGTPSPDWRIEIDSIDFTNSYCHVKYRIFEFSGHSPNEKTMMLYNTEDGVRVKIAKCVNEQVQSEQDMLRILGNNILYHHRW